MGFLSPGAPDHNLLSSIHVDTTAATPNAGDLIRGSAVPASWERFTVGSSGAFVRSTGTLPAWSTLILPNAAAISTLLYASAADTISALATANSGVLVTSGTGVPSIGTDIPTAVTIGTAYIHRVGGTDVAVADGGTGLSSYAVGALLYASAATTLAGLADVATGSYLASGGVGVAPAWETLNQAAVAGLTTASTPTFTGVLLSGLSASVPVVTDGSKNLASQTYASFKTSLAIAQADVSGLTTASSPTFTGLTLSGLTASKPVFTDANKALVSTGTLGVDQGGTGLASYAVGDLIYASGATTLAKLADVAAGAYLRSGGVTTAPLWSTLLLPNAATANRVGYATATNTWGESADLTFDGSTFKTLAAHFLGSAGSPAGQVYIKSVNAGTIALVVDAAATPSTFLAQIRNNGATRFDWYAEEVVTGAPFALSDFNAGNNVRGRYISLGRNTSAGAVGPAAGFAQFTQASGNPSYVWSDATGKLRVNTDAPTGSSGTPTISDTAGTVIGDQTSWHETKNILGPSVTTPAAALKAMCSLTVYDFQFKESSYKDVFNQSPTFTGLVGYNRGSWFLKNVGRQQTPALNDINLFGYAVLSLQALNERVSRLEAR